MPILISLSRCHSVRVVRFALCSGAFLLCATFGCSSRQARPSASPVVGTLKEVFACIKSGNAHKLYPLILPEERDKERLTEQQLAVLLRVIGRCLVNGATPGPMILDGTDNNVTGFVEYRRPNNRKTMIGVYCQKSQDGTIGARGITYNLTMAVASSITNPAGKILSKELDFRKDRVLGLKGLPGELRSGGPQLLLGSHGVVSIDELLAQQEERIRTLEAKN